MDRAIAAIVDALRRGRQADTGCGGQSSLSCSQPAFSQQQRAAPGAPWLPEVQEVLGRLSAEELPQLVHQASEADVLDLLKALQHACAPGTCAGRSLCLALAQVCALRPQESTGLRSPHRLKPVFCCAQTCVRDPSATAGRRGREVFNFVSSQADALGGSDSASVVLAILDAVSNPHENMAKVLELLPKLMLPVLPSRLPGYA